jgi:hypothetical protein
MIVHNAVYTYTNNDINIIQYEGFSGIGFNTTQAVNNAYNKALYKLNLLNNSNISMIELNNIHYNLLDNSIKTQLKTDWKISSHSDIV